VAVEEPVPVPANVVGAKVVVEEPVPVPVEVVVPDSVGNIVDIADGDSDGEKEKTFLEPFLDFFDDFFDDFLELLLPFMLPHFEELEEDDPPLPLFFEDLELPKIVLSVLGVGFGWFTLMFVTMVVDSETVPVVVEEPVSIEVGVIVPVEVEEPDPVKEPVPVPVEEPVPVPVEVVVSDSVGVIVGTNNGGSVGVGIICLHPFLDLDPFLDFFEDFESLLLPLPFVDLLELEELPLFEDLELCKIFDPIVVMLSIVEPTTLVTVGTIFVIVGLSIPPVGLSTACGLERGGFVAPGGGSGPALSGSQHNIFAEHPSTK